VETYTRNLVQWLARLDSENRYSVFINKESVGVFEALAPGVTVVPCPIRASRRPIRILWEQFVLPFQVRSRKVDLLLSTGLTAPILCHATSLVVLHDLQHLNQPHNFSWLYLQFLKLIIRASAKSADGVITVSNHVKKDVERFYGIASERIAVSHLGVDPMLFNTGHPTREPSFRQRYGLPERYILYAAASLPHKNHARLFAALQLARKQIPDLKLVLIGARDRGEESLIREIDRLGLHDDVLLLGWLPLEDVPLIYRGCEAFVFPTLHEGFGLPIIEAMACGVPVVCSNIEPLIEVAGEAARFVNPLEPEDIARGIIDVLTDEGLRSALIDRGLERAHEFAWEETAKHTLDFVNAMAGRRKRLT
jgi:glycosyltransferase involved in cell wall biosynthesis